MFLLNYCRRYLTGNGTTIWDSLPQNLTIPARPAAPGVTAIPPNLPGGSGGISGTTADMEYSIDSDDWSAAVACGTGSTINLAQGTYYVRVAASNANSNFYGAATQVDIGDIAARPTASPSGGAYTAAQSVTLTSTTEGATIYYTTDGSNPTTTSAVYGGAINVPMGTTLKAFAVKGGMTDSTVMTETYTQKTNPQPDPDPSPAYTRQILKDETTGVTLSGWFTAGTSLVIIPKVLHEKGACDACDEIRAAGSWVSLYDVTITGGSHNGNMELTLLVPSGYNGQQM